MCQIIFAPYGHLHHLQFVGFYIREFNSRLYLESKARGRARNDFDTQASFYMRSNTFFTCTFAFEWSITPEWFISYFDENTDHLRIRRVEYSKPDIINGVPKADASFILGK